MSPTVKAIWKRHELIFFHAISILLAGTVPESAFSSAPDLFLSIILISNGKKLTTQHMRISKDFMHFNVYWYIVCF